MLPQSQALEAAEADTHRVRTKRSAVVGLVGGAAIGDHLQNDTVQDHRECRRFERVEQRLRGYRVKYTYANRPGAIALPEAPHGDALPVQVDVRPEFSR